MKRKIRGVRAPVYEQVKPTKHDQASGRLCGRVTWEVALMVDTSYFVQISRDISPSLVMLKDTLNPDPQE